MLLTGGCGFIGSHCYLELLKHECDIVIVDNFSNSDYSILEKMEKLAGRKIICYDIDINNDIDFIFRTHDIKCVIHFAAYKAVGESVKDPLKYYSNNLGGLISLLKCMLRNNVHNLIFSSSATVYGHNSFSNAGNKFLGGAIVASFNGGISSIVNDSGGNSSGIYNSFIIDDASDYIFSPLSRVEFPSGIRTGHQIQNICSTVITVDVLYITNTDFTIVPAPTAGPFVIQPGTSATAFIPPGSGFDGWIGTFTAKTQGGEQCIVGITNDQVDNFDSSVFNLIKINE